MMKFGYEIGVSSLYCEAILNPDAGLTEKLIKIIIRSK